MKSHPSLSNRGDRFSVRVYTRRGRVFVTWIYVERIPSTTVVFPREDGRVTYFLWHSSTFAVDPNLTVLCCIDTSLKGMAHTQMSQICKIARQRMHWSHTSTSLFRIIHSVRVSTHHSPFEIGSGHPPKKAPHCCLGEYGASYPQTRSSSSCTVYSCHCPFCSSAPTFFCTLPTAPCTHGQ